MRRRVGIAVLTCALLALTAGSLLADIPMQLTYQGKLTDETGQPVADGSYTMDFVLFMDSTGDVGVWKETNRQVKVTDGLFTVNLGEDSPLRANAFDGPRWLAVKVNGVELAPRTMLTPSPYTFWAHTAEHVVDSAAVTSLNSLSGSVTLSAGDNMSIQQDGNDITLSATTSIPDPLPVSQSGEWNVGITGTPAVSISSSGNTVVTRTSYAQHLLFDSDQVIPDNTEVWTHTIDCSGFREIRGCIKCSNPSEDLQVLVYFETATGFHTLVGRFDFGVPTESIAIGANFTPVSTQCMFTIPVMGGSVRFTVRNNTGHDVTIYNSSSWLYLVN